MKDKAKENIGHLLNNEKDTGQSILDVVNKKAESIKDEAKGVVSFVTTLKQRKGEILKKSVISGIIIFGTVVSTSFIFWFIKSFDRECPSVLNFGDVMLDRGVRNIMERSKRDPFVNIKTNKNILEKYDIVAVNLEGPIVEMDRSLCQQKVYNFQFAENSGEKLKSAGINMVNLANNHSYDCLKKGLERTKEILGKSGISYMGDNVIEKSFVIKEIDKKKIAFVGIDATVAFIPVSKFYPLIEKLKSENDYVVVNIHWGEEYNLNYTKDQMEIAHKLIDSGADVIFGHHPHVVEPVEVYKEAVIFYSLGNFVFDQGFGETKVGLGAGVQFERDKILVTVYPINIFKFIPQFMEGKEKGEFCEKFLNEISASIGCSFEVLKN
jgi:poly-gamma-glutamate synthesis protein (capsule biosynthesis protein)